MTHGDVGTAENVGAPTVPGYEGFRWIGGGGFSTVYSATQARFERTVALKVLNADIADGRAERDFSRECRLTGRLGEHPNIITLYDAGRTSDRRAYIAMPYFPDGSFADLLRREGPLSARRAVEAMARIADALAEAHRQRILHRDVKPANILLGRSGEPILSDFGIASVERDADVSGNLDALTPMHTAPEIIEGGRPTPAADIFSLGSTLYTLLEGRAPYAPPPGASPTASSTGGVLLRMLREPFPAPSASLPPDVVDLLGRMLDHDPARRPGTAAELADELSERARGLVSPTLPRPPERALEKPVAAGPRTPAHPDPDGVTRHSPTLRGPNTVPPWREVSGEVPGQSGPPRPVAPGDPLRADDLLLPVASDVAGQGTVIAPRIAPEERAPTGPGRDGPSRTRRVRRHLLAAACAGVAAAVAAVVLLTASGGAAPTQPLGQSSAAGAVPSPLANGSPAPRPSASAPATTAAATGPVDLGAARPRDVRLVGDNGRAVSLAWRSGLGDHPLAIQATSEGGQSTITPVPAGATAGEVTGLSPEVGYCFLVMAILSGEPEVAASDPPLCIRGAFVQS